MGDGAGGGSHRAARSPGPTAYTQLGLENPSGSGPAMGLSIMSPWLLTVSPSARPPWHPKGQDREWAGDMLLTSREVSCVHSESLMSGLGGRSFSFT